MGDVLLCSVRRSYPHATSRSRGLSEGGKKEKSATTSNHLSLFLCMYASLSLYFSIVRSLIEAIVSIFWVWVHIAQPLVSLCSSSTEPNAATMTTSLFATSLYFCLVFKRICYICVPLYEWITSTLEAFSTENFDYPVLRKSLWYTYLYTFSSLFFMIMMVIRVLGQETEMFEHILFSFSSCCKKFL